MSERTPTRPQQRGPQPGGPAAGMAMPVEKSMHFGPSAKRLLGRPTAPECHPQFLRYQRWQCCTVRWPVSTAPDPARDLVALPPRRP